MQEEQDSFYSQDEQYFMDLCRGNEFQELKQFISSLPLDSKFNWGWFNNSNDNFMRNVISQIDMIAANNLVHVFDYLMPIITKRCSREQMFKILNKQNSSGCTPLRIDANELDYAVITNSKEMVSRLIEVGVNTGIGNQSKRTAFEEAVKFKKYQIAEMLAPVTKTDVDALRKQVGEVQLNEDESDDQDDGKIQQKKQEEIEKQQYQQIHEEVMKSLKKQKYNI